MVDFHRTETEGRLAERTEEEEGKALPGTEGTRFSVSCHGNKALLSDV